jgi:hypothetical protein
MRSLAAILLLSLVAPAFAEQTKPTEQAKPTKKPAVGEGYDLPKRGHHTTVPQDAAAVAKVTTVTEAMVAKVAKVRHGEVEYFEIEPTGEVAAIEVCGDAPSAATTCIADLAHRWTFPAVDAKSTIDYPIRLR